MKTQCGCHCHLVMHLLICFDCKDNHPHHPALRTAEHAEITHSIDPDNQHLNPASLKLF